MKRFLKFAGLLLITAVVALLAYTYISFNYYAPADPEVEVDASALKYFQDDWSTCRNAFRNEATALQERIDSIALFSVPVKSETDTDLTIDFCYIPASDTTKKLVVINSGIHGIEGFVGSAVQQMLMAEFFQPEMFRETGVLMIHGMNAWGFKNQRRFSENNVDLNRNYSLQNSLYQTPNDGFISLYNLLTPKGEVNMNSLPNRFFMLKAMVKIAQKGMPALLQAFAQGQYQFQEGIYFGGFKAEQQVEIISEVLKKYATNYSILLNLDLHTGFGERGRLHLFPNPVDDPQLKNTMEEVFAGYQIDWGDSDNFYTVHGQFVEFVGDLFPEKTSIPMLMELGTLNTGSTVGAVKSAHITVTENQGHKYGFKTEADREKVKAGYYEMFYPPSEKWRTNAIQVSRKMMEDILRNFQELKE